MIPETDSAGAAAVPSPVAARVPVPYDDGGIRASEVATLPACRLDRQGRPAVDIRAILALALPLFLNSSIQAVLNLTDTWFIGRISATAVAAVASIHWMILAILLLLGGVAMGVQTIAAQAYGSGRRRRAGQALWSGIWASLLTIPVFILLGWLGPSVLGRLGFEDEIVRQAGEYWLPRMGGGTIALLLWAPMSFLYGTGQVRTAVLINVVVAIVNALLNELLMFRLGIGIAGAAWATNAALATGFAIAMTLIIRSAERRRIYGIHLLWRPRRRAVLATIAFGLPVGVSIAFDLLGLAVFQLMMTWLGVVDAAATQIVMMLTSLSFMPAIGLGMAGTTLVGQSIGAGRPEWARRLGNRVTLMAVVHMGGVGLLLGLAGPWLAPLFVNGEDPRAAAVVALTVQLLWIAACYQLFDGLQLGCNFCLRGAGDARFTAVTLLVLSWGLFLPLTHMLAFDSGAGPIAALPGANLGAVGGWWASVLYIGALAVALSARWRSGRWTTIKRVG